jgi:ADP-ribose pyrophosphatase YjhB (NUDIX family)
MADPENNFEWLVLAKRIQSIAQAGLAYNENKYDIERYQQIREISLEIMHHYTGFEMKKLSALFAAETGYQTPKTDVRGVVFRGDKILMVHETIDGNWSLPGGWADIGLSPAEVAVKEVFEESGLLVKPSRLMGVLDKNKHSHPPDPFHTYKIFMLCEETGGMLKGGMETSEAGFFGMHELPPLSAPRITKEQIDLLFKYRNKQKAFYD